MDDVAAWLEWMANVIVRVMRDEQAGPLFLGIIIGMFATEMVAHALNPSMPAWQADRLTRLIVLGIATCVTFFLLPTQRGFVLALLAGTSAPTIHGFVTRCVYNKWPHAKPPALRE